MKGIYLLPCILFMSLSSSERWGINTPEFPLGFEFSLDQDRDVLDDSWSAKSTKSQYCPELQCWSLNNQCWLHNKRLIFFSSMLNASKKKKVTREVSSVLPMMPQGLRHLIGSYAWEKPTQYKIKGYQQICYTSYLQKFLCLDNGGKLVLDAANTNITIQSTGNSYKHPNVSVTLTPIETDFFKYTIKDVTDSHITWQQTANGTIELLMQNKENTLAQDKLFLKLSFANNKALQAAGLLPKKLKNKADA